MADQNSSPAARDSKTEEFLRLMGRHERRMMAMVLGMVSDWAAAEDICQEVRVRLWNEFDRYDRSKDFGAWARTIAYYEVLTWRKQSQRQPHMLGDEFLSAVAEEVSRLPDDQAERLRALGLCLRDLSEPSRSILMRYYRQSETLRQIAEHLGRTFDATRQMLLRTRKSLAKCIAQRLKQDQASGETA